MNKRPKIEVKPNAVNKTTETVSWVVLVIYLAFAAYAYNVLPDTIPAHFNFKGEVDAEGSKASFFILPLVGVATFLLLTVIGRHPHLFNYSVEITEENAEFQYRNAMQMMRVLKLVMILMFFAVSFITYCTAKGMINGTGALMPILLATVPVLPIIYFVMKMKRGK